MPRTLTPKDAHILINEICRQATGQEPEISAVDTNSFISVGETILATGTENTLNAISMVIGRTFMAVRPYTSKFRILEEVDSSLFKMRVRKISFYSRDSLPAGDWNTDIYTNLANGYTNGQNIEDGDPNSTKSMWVQNQAMPLELSFFSQDVWQDSTTVYRDQLKVAFTDEESFNSFVAGILTEKGNDIEIQRESFRRMVLLNHIGGVFALSEDYPTMAVNMTTAYNTRFGTNYTSAELRTTYLKSFLEFMVATIKTISRRMEYRSSAFHMPYTKEVDSVNYSILRHTPRERQALFLYSPLLIESESMVMPEIFNDEYLKIENYEAVDFWQNFNDPAKVVVKPAIPGENGTQTTTDEAITIPYLIGCIFDRDSILCNNYIEDALSTPWESRKRYSNIWWSFCRGAISDYSENFVIFYMDDSGVTPTPGTGMTVTPNTVNITLNESGEGSADVTITNLPEATENVALLNTYDGAFEIGVDSGDVYTISVDDDATENYTDHNIIIVTDENNNILDSANITINIIVPEG